MHIPSQPRLPVRRLCKDEPLLVPRRLVALCVDLLYGPWELLSETVHLNRVVLLQVILVASILESPKPSLPRSSRAAQCWHLAGAPKWLNALPNQNKDLFTDAGQLTLGRTHEPQALPQLGAVVLGSLPVKQAGFKSVTGGGSSQIAR